MVKRAVTLMLALSLALSMTIPAFASRYRNSSSSDDDWGFTREGTFTDSTVQYGFMPDDTEVVFNGDVPWYWDWDEISTGSAIYIPLWRYDDTGNTTQDSITPFSSIRTSDSGSRNTNKDLVEVSWMCRQGSQYVQSVTIVDGNKERVNELVNGAYVKVQLVDSYDSGGAGARIVLTMSLSVNRTFYQDTDTELTIRMTNPLVYVDRNTVYGARVSTTFFAQGYEGPATFDMGNNIRYSTQVARNQRYVINMNTDANADIAARFPDAYIEYYSFPGNSDTFAAVGNLQIPIDTNKFRDSNGQTTVFAYTVEGNTLTSLGGASYDASNRVLNISTQTLHNYVLSNQPLSQTVDATADTTLQQGYASAETTGVDDEQGTVATEAGTITTPDYQDGVENPNMGGDDDDGVIQAGGGDRYAYEETGVAPGTINAANPPGDNPSTSGTAMVDMMACTSVLAGVSGAVYYKKKRPFAKEDRDAD